jgi:hypothetical protein
MEGNQRALGNSGGNPEYLIQNDPEVQRLKNLKIKRAKELLKLGKSKTETIEIIIKEFKLNRDPSNGWPSWLSNLELK